MIELTTTYLMKGRKNEKTVQGARHNSSTRSRFGTNSRLSKRGNVRGIEGVHYHRACNFLRINAGLPADTGWR